MDDLDTDVMPGYTAVSLDMEDWSGVITVLRDTDEEDEEEEEL